MRAHTHPSAKRYVRESVCAQISLSSLALLGPNASASERCKSTTRTCDNKDLKKVAWRRVAMWPPPPLSVAPMLALARRGRRPLGPMSGPAVNTQQALARACARTGKRRRWR
ncbi:unnamed protein product [Schistocephalus solidus]|uniref:Secreted protein n=1 Tax=Schistocephalus solidus TaxID=70667 RepID=A0A183TL92_SCHSO|nr:unnamed protein product [Schistocephalus solidus]